MIKPCDHVDGSDGQCTRCGMRIGEERIRVGDSVRLWTLPNAGALPVIGLAGPGYVWVPNVERIPFIARVGQVEEHLPRVSPRGWFVRPDGLEVESFDYDVCHPLMSPEPPRDATFFATEGEAVDFLLRRGEEEYTQAAARAASARERLARLRQRCAPSLV